MPSVDSAVLSLRWENCAPSFHGGPVVESEKSVRSGISAPEQATKSSS